VVGLAGAFIGLKVIKDVTALATAFLAVLDVNPVFLVIAGLAALVVALDASGIKFKSFGQFFGELWKRLSKQFGEAFAVIKHVVADAVGWIKEWIDKHQRDL